MLVSLKKCIFCGKCGVGVNLPGNTTIYEKAKPLLKTWYAKHEVLRVSVDLEKAGAKTGVDAYRCNSTLPVVVVKPSEWARRDFLTPSIRNLIWSNQKGNNVFTSIETSPIVRNRDIHVSEFRMAGKDGLDRTLVKGSKLEMRIVSNKNVGKVLKKVTFESIIYEKEKTVRTFVIKATVLGTDYISNDSNGHMVVKGNGKERHKGELEKAGDVILYLGCEGAKSRLVNRHNPEVGEPSVYLSFCNGISKNCKVKNVPVEETVCLDEEPADDEAVKNHGYLEDGTQYFVYRFLLYTDGFNSHRSKSGSMDGMYIIPLGIPIDRRTEAGCLHKICLAPPGVAATDIMHHINEDIIMGMTTGIDVYLNGDKCKIFTDLLCYIGDNPALAKETGCKGHSSDTPCHVCSFRRKENETLEVVSSNGILSSSCANRRTFQRAMDIKMQENGLLDIDKLGIGNIEAPLVQLTKKVRDVKQVPKSTNGNEVVPRSFDVYRSSLISPDHVFLGLIGNLLKALLRLMKPKEREEFDVQCVDILRSNGLYSRNSVLNAENNVLKTTISEAYAILFVCPIVFKRMKLCIVKVNAKKDSKCWAVQKLTKLMNKLRAIIVLAQSNPEKTVDAKIDVDTFNLGNGKRRLQKLVEESNNYTRMIEELASEHKESASLLDKPNVHRFMELFVHTLPMFGSLKFIEELILEKAHQSAKKAVDQSNMKNEQVQAMNDYLHDDLVSRLKSLTKDWCEDDSCEITEMKSNLKNFLGSSAESTMDRFNIFRDEVLNTVRIIGKDLCHRDEAWAWFVQDSRSQPCEEYKTLLFKAEERMNRTLHKASTRENWKGKQTCTVGNSAVFRKPKGELVDYQRHSKLDPCDVVEVCSTPIVEKDGIVYRRSNLEGDRIFVRVIGFLRTTQNGRNINYCVGRLLEPTGSQEKSSQSGNEKADCLEIDEDDDLTVHEANENLLIILELCSAVRKTFVAHACWSVNEKSCERNQRDIVHGCENRSSKFVVLGRREGFPPRSG